MTTHPDWLVVLRREIAVTSQGSVALRLGLHQSRVSRVLGGKNRTQAELSRVAERVQQVLIDGIPLDKSVLAPAQNENHELFCPTGTTRRKCLKCRQPFASWGAGNRLCGMCRSSNTHESEYGGLF